MWPFSVESMHSFTQAASDSIDKQAFHPLQLKYSGDFVPLDRKKSYLQHFRCGLTVNI